ncbi:immediate early response gene 2 protein [Salarias fasciatus]|uniref:immediate early response gene 2 protein n=1 Tax=Salarias fasciatus TaxID=181472 RepID=UPI001176B626|nr:immediate early response gene 2 protein-like [Salarias fasciatus]
MEVSAEAKRVMVVALGKLYSSRIQRGGLRLHRSLLLTLVMKSARDIYHAAQATAESVASDWEVEEQQPPAGEMSTEPSGAQDLLAARTSAVEEAAGPSEEEEAAAAAKLRTGAEDKENQRPPGPPQHARKRRGKAAAEPDFLPCKKAKLEQGNSPQPLVVSSVLVDYVMCGSELGTTTPTPIPIQRAIAAC